MNSGMISNLPGVEVPLHGDGEELLEHAIDEDRLQRNVGWAVAVLGVGIGAEDVLLAVAGSIEVGVGGQNPREAMEGDKVGPGFPVRSARISVQRSVGTPVDGKIVIGIGGIAVQDEAVSVSIRRDGPRKLIVVHEALIEASVASSSVFS